MEAAQSTASTQQSNDDQFDRRLHKVDTTDSLTQDRIDYIRRQLNIPTNNNTHGHRDIVRASIELYVSLLLANVQVLLQSKDDRDSWSRATEYLNNAIAVAQEINDPLLLARCSFWAGIAQLREGDPATAHKYFEHALPIIDNGFPESDKLPMIIQKRREQGRSNTQQVHIAGTTGNDTGIQTITSRSHDMNVQSEGTRAPVQDIEEVQGNVNRFSTQSDLYKLLMNDLVGPTDQSSSTFVPGLAVLQEIQTPITSPLAFNPLPFNRQSITESTKNFEGIDVVIPREREKPGRAQRTGGRKVENPSQEQAPGIDTVRIQDWVSDVGGRKLSSPNSPSNTEGSERERRLSSIQDVHQVHSPPSQQSRRPSKSMSARENLFEANISRPNSVAKPNLRINAQIDPDEEVSRRSSSTPTIKSPLREVSLAGDLGNEEARGEPDESSSEY